MDWRMRDGLKTRWVLNGLAVTLLLLGAAFLANLWGRSPTLTPIALVDPIFTNTATVRVPGKRLVAEGADEAAMFECYVCHEQDKPPELKYDENNRLVLPEEHADLVMEHGRHDRNNNCYNCHNEANLEQLQTRDGRELKLVESSPLCGSCHGPTYRDWEAGVHGRISGYWNAELGAPSRADCVACHNPHSPHFPPQKPAPGPHPLRERPPAGSTRNSPHS